MKRLRLSAQPGGARGAGSCSFRRRAEARPSARWTWTTSSRSARWARPRSSPNGQWFAYRLSPLQGDSEVVIRSDVRRQGDEVPGRRRRRRRGRRSRDDSAWAAITMSPTRQRGAGEHARATAESEQRDDRESRDRRQGHDVPKIRRFAFAGETRRMDRAASLRPGQRRPVRRAAARPPVDAAARRAAPARPPTRRATRVRAEPI